VVAAVSGDQVLSFPASLSTVIAAVASDPQGSVTAPVARRKAFLAAPGVDVLTTVPHRAYDFLSGSSFAAAHVSGIVALVLEGNPQLSPREVMELLLATGRPVFISATETAASLRHVDACAALERLVHGASCP